MKRINSQWTAATYAELAEVLGVHPDTPKRWKKQGMPGRSGSYVVPLCVDWLRTRGPWRPQGADPIMDASDEPSPALERYRTARAELAELDVAERCGQLVKVNMIHGTLVITSSRYRKLGQELQKKYGPAAHAMVEKAIDDVERESARFFESLPGDKEDSK